MPSMAHQRHHVAVMGTVFSFVLADRLDRDALAAVDADLQWVDRTFSRWRPDSELNQLRDGRRGLRDCPPEIAEVLELCAHAHQLTDGWFSPGYDGSIDPTGLVKGWAVARASALLRDAG